MSGDEFGGSDHEFSDAEGGEDFSGSDIGSDEGDFDGDSMGSYEGDSDEEMPALVKVGKNGRKEAREPPMELNKKKRQRSHKDGDDSDSQGEEENSDTEYGYEKPHLNHIKSKEKNT